MKLFRKLFIGLVIALCAPFAANAAGTLGIGVSILPSGNTGGADLGNNSQLWFSMQPGSELSREFTVSSSANIDQKITFQLIGLQIVDGVERSNPTKVAEASKWATFSPAQVVLKPRSNIRVKLTFKIPTGTEFGRYDGFMHVVAEAANSSADNSKAKVQAVISNAVAFDQKFWLGVGDGKFLATDFEMKSVRGIIRGEKKFIQIEMKNLGGTPIGPEGTIDLQDTVFAKNHIGPISFGTATVLPGKSRWAEAQVPFETPDGKWKVFVTANQGNVTKTKIFEEEIKFVDEGSGFNFPWQIILIIGFVLLLLFGIRLVVTPGGNTEKFAKRESDSGNHKTAEFNLDLNSLSLEELEAILSSRLGEKPKTKKKAAARKPASKTVKKAAKKAPVKKSAKSAPKKAAKKPAKKSAKKAPAKRSTGRK